ncbi:MAG: hypothetical protein AAGD11_20950 [Planctomycetota bacterium]
MPDWTYQTLLKPPLTQLGFDRGTAIALGSMGRLAALPGGTWLIQFMGHMHPDERLAHQRHDVHFDTRVGLGCGIDPQLRATQAIAEFGFGYLEVGPIVDCADEPATATTVDDGNESICYQSNARFLTADQAVAKLQQIGTLKAPIFARLQPDSAESAVDMINQLTASVAGFVIPAQWLIEVMTLRREPDEEDEILYIAAVNHDDWHSAEVRNPLLDILQSGEVAGVAAVADDRRLGKVHFEEAVELVTAVREELGPEPLVIGTVGVHEPADALEYLDAGADLLQVDSGLVFSGPSLPKRINEATLFRQLDGDGWRPTTRSVAQQSWLWSFLMGLGMFVGGLLALGIAATRVVMPYDESSIGMVRGELMQINERLLPFMQHDRVTLAGTMLAIGVLYIALAVYGIRRGEHWAYIAMVVSAATGFFSFFTFLGFGYFDPFHAFVSAVLLQFLLLTTILPQAQSRLVIIPDLWNDKRWRRHQWGQLSFVVHGAVLIVAGIVISVIGMTSVFVSEDLEFLRCSQRVLTEANPMLVPLVAHDRATFGGMLIATGIVTMLAAMWGFRHGQAWLWWALMLAGNLAYWSAIGVHWAVGYNSLIHLIPAYGGLALLWLGGWASYAYMVQSDGRLHREWQRRIDATG